MTVEQEEAIKDYLEVFDLGKRDLCKLLDMAVVARQKPHGMSNLLKDEIVFAYFAKPSTRTRVSFSAAIAHLGGVAEFVGPDELQLGRGETIQDTAMVVSRYARAAVIRTFDHQEVADFAAAASIPVVNALTDLHHPCQALADMLTIRDHFGALPGRKVAYVGAGNNVAHSLIQACALVGIDVRVATPIGLEPDMALVAEARTVAGEHEGSVEVTHDVAEAVKEADVVYTDVWVSMGDALERQEERRLLLEPYRVTDALMAMASASAIFMHCLPAHRGDEVVDEVIDGPQSLVATQAENRMHTEQALLEALLSGSLTGQET